MNPYDQRQSPEGEYLPFITPRPIEDIRREVAQRQITGDGYTGARTTEVAEKAKDEVSNG